MTEEFKIKIQKVFDCRQEEMLSILESSILEVVATGIGLGKTRIELWDVDLKYTNVINEICGRADIKWKFIDSTPQVSYHFILTWKYGDSINKVYFNGDKRI